MSMYPNIFSFKYCLKIYHIQRNRLYRNYCELAWNLTHSTQKKPCLSSSIFELHFTVFCIPFYSSKNSILSVKHRETIQSECTTRVSISLFINKLKIVFPHALTHHSFLLQKDATKKEYTKCQYKNGKSH